MRAHRVSLNGSEHLVLELPVAPTAVLALTPAERAVVQLALAGLGNAAIAEARKAALSTVENQLSAAYKKLGVSSRVELARTLAGRRDHVDPAVSALLSGEWRLVESFDSGSRRFLIAAAAQDPLSPSEKEVLARRAGGALLKQIAADLGLSEPTVSRRLKSGMHKLGLRTVADLVRLYETEIAA